MQTQVFLNEAAPARIDAVASDLSLSRKANFRKLCLP